MIGNDFNSNSELQITIKKYIIIIKQGYRIPQTQYISRGIFKR